MSLKKYLIRADNSSLIRPTGGAPVRRRKERRNAAAASLTFGAARVFSVANAARFHYNQNVTREGRALLLPAETRWYMSTWE